MTTRRVLIANRGEIAMRILRTVHARGWEAIAVWSEDDRLAPHVGAADVAVRLARRGSVDPYRDGAQIIEAALAHGAWGVHPGYGFLSEDAAFAAAVEAAGLVFVGPTPEQIARFGDKHQARLEAREAGVPMTPATGLLTDVAHACEAIATLGLPVVLKATNGGGGAGMAVVERLEEVEEAFARVSRVAALGGAVYAERYIRRARHVEVQLFGDGEGGVVTLGDRDCTLQRRHQKVVEEAPAFGLAPDVRSLLHRAARRLGERVGYRSAGTVEFVLDADSGEAYFLEVNTRLQVEHPVTEAVTGVDLVDWMLAVAAGDASGLAPHLASGEVPVVGAAVESRLYAEEPSAGFRPCSGTLTRVALPLTQARVDHWIATGTEVGTAYDPLLAKIITAGTDRVQAWERQAAALAATRVDGIETNLGLLVAAAASAEVRAGAHTTASLGHTVVDAGPRIRVESPGLFTTVQQWPGRRGLWHIGVPPSGPMDDLSFRLGNEALGNSADAAGLECTVTGPSLTFTQDTWVCVTGAPAPVRVAGAAVTMWEPVLVPAGASLEVGTATAGRRTYVLVEGGIDVPEHLGSRATFALGRFGGHAGRRLRAADVLRPGPVPRLPRRRPVPEWRRPEIGSRWELGVVDGPHTAPDFLNPADVEDLYSAEYAVDVNSDRTGVRLDGPRPRWARADGGDAGLHPSNIHDTPYAVGALDFTGDTPVLLGPDGPSLGGFVCPVTVVSDERWKLGQLAPGDSVCFARRPAPGGIEAPDGVLARLEGPAQAVIRRSGDDHLLVEFGEMTLDLALRARVHALHLALRESPPGGLRELTPGVRSLQLGFDPAVRSAADALGEVAAAVAALPQDDALTVPSRRVHLPLSWDDPATREAIARYEAGVRDDAPWNPWNIEFIRRVNGLDTVEEVHATVFEAEYLVLGLGDVYLGAPVATPLDPRHRLVTTKYNPARTWTAENSVGIGGAYLCIYGMEGPGGYQFVGRTTQVWQRWQSFEGADRAADGTRPWLLDWFDRIVWHPVGAEELLELREEMAAGRWRPRIEDGEFALGEYLGWLDDQAEDIDRFRARQGAAFRAERERWRASGEFDRARAVAPAPDPDGAPQPGPGEVAVAPPFAAKVWKVAVEEGARVEAGDTLAVIEAMKMETAVVSPAAGVVARVLVAPGGSVTTETPVAFVRADV